MKWAKTEENPLRWTMREKSMNRWVIPIANHQMRIPDDLTPYLQELWTNAISYPQGSIKGTGKLRH